MTKSFSYISLAIIIFAIIIRLIGMIEYPFHDPTEARYAEIPRLIIETGQWIMPPFDYDVPFWGKPPLTFWMTALSYQLFGYSEFAARLPILLLAGMVVWLSYAFAKVLLGDDKAVFSSIVLISTGLFYVASGAVMTDMALCLCITLSLISFWHALHHAEARQAKKWSYLFFVGMGFGLLVKGPIVGVLVLLPLIAWVSLEKKWLLAWQQIPWFKGSALMLLIAAPWYIIAEIDSPGFINYFLVGEHFKRFVDTGWHGDLYGIAHKHRRGLIWLLWLLAAFPWSFIFIGCAVSWRSRKNQHVTLKNACGTSWHSYLVFWAIAPMVFFTFSGNILYTYVLPGLPAFAMMVSEMLTLRFNIKSIMYSKWLYAGLIVPVTGLIFIGLLWTIPEKLNFEKNQKHFVQVYLDTRKSADSQLSYMGERLYSVSFYTQGRAHQLDLEAEALGKLNDNAVEDFLIIEQNMLSFLSVARLKNFEIIERFRNYALLKEKKV